MGFGMKKAKHLSLMETLGLGFLAGLFLSVFYLPPTIFYPFPLTNVNSLSISLDAAPTNQMINDSMISSPKLGLEDVTHESIQKCHGWNSSQGLCEQSGLLEMHGNSSTNINSKIGNQDASNTQSLLVKQREYLEPKEVIPLCNFSNPRSNLCDMKGDIRVHGKSSTVISVTSSKTDSSPRNESWQIRPYARKGDHTAMAKVRELTVKSLKNYEDPPHCTLNHNVPGIVFSLRGYSGNFFHDFSDVFVPLFLTSYQFHGEVQFLVANLNNWWIGKYLPIIKNLSRYKIIDLDNDDSIRCFRHAIVGLKSHDDLKIDTWRSPNGYSMLDFTKFLRTTYSLPRATLVTFKEKKPRLLIIARRRTRRLTNLDDIVQMAENSGYEVVVGEADSNVTRFAHMVNSCDVMLGVHGAGLTNFVFLPMKAIVIQIVPWGKLDWISRTYFNKPTKGMNLTYLEYDVSVEESTLTELYPSDHPVLRDPGSMNKQGYQVAAEIYLIKQNVKLNVTRFKPVLLKALKLLHEL